MLTKLFASLKLNTTDTTDTTQESIQKISLVQQKSVTKIQFTDTVKVAYYSPDEEPNQTQKEYSQETINDKIKIDNDTLKTHFNNIYQKVKEKNKTWTDDEQIKIVKIYFLHLLSFMEKIDTLKKYSETLLSFKDITRFNEISRTLKKRKINLQQTKVFLQYLEKTRNATILEFQQNRAISTHNLMIDFINLYPYFFSISTMNLNDLQIEVKSIFNCLYDLSTSSWVKHNSPVTHQIWLDAVHEVFPHIDVNRDEIVQITVLFDDIQDIRKSQQNMLNRLLYHISVYYRSDYYSQNQEMWDEFKSFIKEVQSSPNCKKNKICCNKKHSHQDIEMVIKHIYNSIKKLKFLPKNMIEEDKKALKEQSEKSEYYSALFQKYQLLLIDSLSSEIKNQNKLSLDKLSRFLLLIKKII